jgi:hypothetical protein
MRERSKPEGWRREAAPLTRARPAARGGTRQEFRRHPKLMQREAAWTFQQSRTKGIDADPKRSSIEANGKRLRSLANKWLESRNILTRYICLETQ